MMNKQIRVEKLLVELNVSLLVAQSKFNPYKHEIVYRGKAIRQVAPAAICSCIALTC